jgi:hypothetical protein
MDCYVCGRGEAEDGPTNDRKMNHWVQCAACGDYVITHECKSPLNDPKQGLRRRKVARWLHETRYDGERFLSNGPVQLDDSWTGKALDLRQAESLYEDDGSALEKYDNTLSKISAATATFGQKFDTVNDRWLIQTMDDSELHEIIDALVQEGYIGTTGKLLKPDEPQAFWLTVNGLRRAAEMKRNVVESNSRVFIAACFAEELKPAIEVVRGVVSELGYKPKVVTDAHTNLIDLEIYEGIRESRFIVADLTCNRQSVYYEVGFAHGLGVDVVLTCRHDHFEDKSDDFKWVHFDLNHRSVLVWQTEDELAKMLRQHIWQVFGRGGDAVQPLRS